MSKALALIFFITIALIHGFFVQQKQSNRQFYHGMNYLKYNDIIIMIHNIFNISCSIFHNALEHNLYMSTLVTSGKVAKKVLSIRYLDIKISR